MRDRLSDNLKETLEKAERYTLVALFSAVVFAVLSLPEVQVGAPGEGVKWTLLGFSLSFDPRLALLILYVVFVFSCLFADNMLLHIRNLVKEKDPKEVGEILAHPTILTVSPIGRFAVTVIPSLFIIFGLWRSYNSGGFQLPSYIWWVVYAFGGLLGPWVYGRVWHCIRPHLRY